MIYLGTTNVKENSLGKHSNFSGIKGIEQESSGGVCGLHPCIGSHVFKFTQAGRWNMWVKS